MKTRIHINIGSCFALFNVKVILHEKENMFVCLFRFEKCVEQHQSKYLSNNVPTYLVFCIHFNAEKGIRRRTEEDNL